MCLLRAQEHSGKSVFQSKLCHSCHGDAGISPFPNYPNLAGHHPLYVLRQVKDIRKGARSNGITLLMKVFPTLGKLTEEEIEAIAEYVASLAP